MESCERIAMRFNSNFHLVRSRRAASAGPSPLQPKVGGGWERALCQPIDASVEFLRGVVDRSSLVPLGFAEIVAVKRGRGDGYNN